MELPADRYIKSGLYTFGIAAGEFQSNGGARFPSLATSNGTGTAIDSATAGAYSKVIKYASGAPTGTDCDAAGETGRSYCDTSTFICYVCFGTSGWKAFGPGI
jgi:hypothetical protein